MDHTDGAFFPDRDARVWLRAFYGFDPEGSGYIGFTHPKDQQSMLNQMEKGDLVLIYGAVDSLTQQNLRSQALGFLEVDLEPCDDRSRMSDEAYQWKIDRGFQDRWTHGIRVRRAWRVRNRVGINTIAPEAYASENRFLRTTKAIRLTDAERLRALSHIVRQVNVFGEPPIPEDEIAVGPMAKIWVPSKGPVPSFGERSAMFADGENSVYLLEFDGPSGNLLGGTQSNTLFKVGRTNDGKRRLKEVNCGFPPSATVRWKMSRCERFADAATAHSVESELKELFARDYRPEGGEFFSGPRRAVEKAFSDVCIQRMHKILGAAAKAIGI